MQLYRVTGENVAQRSAEISVSVTGLTKLYRLHKKDGRKKTGAYLNANDNISLEIKKGEIFGLLGPNGAGKTTLINQIMGLSRPDSGSIKVEGIDVIARPDRVKSITGYLPQHGTAFGLLEVSRALNYTGQLRGLKAAEARHQAQGWIRELELEEVADRYLNLLSGGMKRMVSLAMALMGYPRLLVLDEPTNELDPARRRLVWETIRQVIRERESTCILVTHNVLEAENVLEQLAILNRGKVQALGSPGELKQAHSGEARIDLSLKNPANQGGVLFDLPVRIEPVVGRPGQYRLYCQAGQAGSVLDSITYRLGLEGIDDFKVALPSLEDVYLQLVGRNGSEIPEGERGR